MLAVAVAGWRVELSGLPSALAGAAAARYASFLAPGPGPVACSVAVDVLPAAVAPGEAPARHVRGVLQLHGRDYVLDEPGIHGRIAVSCRQASVALSSVAPLEDLEYYLRVVFAVLAFREGGLLVHGAGLLDGGRVRLFVGQSGSGKTTVVGLSAGVLALGDDLIVLRPEEEGWHAWGTPFWNRDTGDRHGETAGGRLAAIYKLVQDQAVYVEPMSPAAAAAELVANCPVVNGLAGLVGGLLARCRELSAAVPVRRLHFRKDGSFWPAVRAASDGNPGA